MCEIIMLAKVHKREKSHNFLSETSAGFGSNTQVKCALPRQLNCTVTKQERTDMEST